MAKKTSISVYCSECGVQYDIKIENEVLENYQIEYCASCGEEILPDEVFDDDYD